MDIITLSSASTSTFLSSTSLIPKLPSSTHISFSLKPPSPPPPPPPPHEPSNSPFPRRPKSLNSTTPVPSLPPTPPSITPKNPLKTSLSPTPTPINSNNNNNNNNSLSLSSKLWLSSKLSPPPPPPSPQIQTPTDRTKILTKPTETERVETNEYRQPGKIFVGNLPTWIKKPQVTEVFRQFGPIKNVILIKGHNEYERNVGFCFVIYDGMNAEKSALKAVEFDGMEFHGRVLTVKLDDGKRLRVREVERKRWLGGDDGQEFRSKWHEEREGSRMSFRKVLEMQPENWQAVVGAFERIKKV